MVLDKQKILNNLDIPEFYKELLPSLKVNGKPEALGLCPFHNDTNPSLSVNVETGLFRCFSCDAKGDVFAFYQKYKDCDFATALKEIGKMAGIVESNMKSKIVARFEYQDENNKTLYIKERWEPGRNGRSKEFVFKHLKDGKWTMGRGCDAVLYRLPELIESKYAFVVEGEGKADLLNSWGLTATCLDSGANSPWKDEYLKVFEGKEKVVIFSDNDRPGRAYASKVATVLRGKVNELKIVELPGLGEAEDVIDWSKTLGNDKSALLGIIENAPRVTKESNKTDSTFVLTRLNDLFSEPEESTTWLVDGMLLSGGFSILVGKPKEGKSTCARNLAFSIARGKPFFGRMVTRGIVLYLALEEKRSEVKKHFQDMGAIGDEEIYIHTSGAPTDAISQIKCVVEKIMPVLLIVDPLFRFTRIKDGNDYAQVTNALEPLLRLARDTQTHVLCVHHSRKGESSPQESFLGS